MICISRLFQLGKPQIERKFKLSNLIVKHFLKVCCENHINITIQQYSEHILTCFVLDRMQIARDIAKNKINKARLDRRALFETVCSL